MNVMKKEMQRARDILNSSPANPDLLKEIKKKRFRLSDLTINNRNAVHWESRGLFLNKKQEGTWQHLDTSEATWILIVQKLRDFNFRLELINGLKNDFLNQPISIANDKNREEIKEAIRAMNNQNVEHIINSEAFDEFINSMAMTILETILMDIIYLRNNYRILFNTDGGYVLVKDDFLDHPLQKGINEYMSKSHFSLSVNEIVAELLGKMDLNLATNSYKMISQEEMNVLSILRTENIESVEIRLDSKSKNIEYINFTETIRVNAYQRIHDVMMRNQYQEITITAQNGRVATCKRKIKLKQIP
jgi:hypothetical protein